MPKGRPQAVLFDFYNTLGTDCDPDDLVAARVLAEYGYTLDPVTVRDAQAAASGWLDEGAGVDHSAHSGSREQYNRYQLTLHEGWLRSLGVDPQHPGLFNRMADEWDRVDRICLFEDTLPALGSLKARGLRLGLVSNWSWGLQEVLDATGITPLMECTIISARAGYRKPHPDIYRLALEALGLPAEAVIFVGDSPHADVEGPLEAGMRVVHIDRFGYHGPRDGVPRITRLDELSEVVLAFEAQPVSQDFP